jgi:hypothetical protein
MFCVIFHHLLSDPVARSFVKSPRGDAQDNPQRRTGLPHETRRESSMRSVRQEIIFKKTKVLQKSNRKRIRKHSIGSAREQAKNRKMPTRAKRDIFLPTWQVLLQQLELRVPPTHGPNRITCNSPNSSYARCAGKTIKI